MSNKTTRESMMTFFKNGGHSHDGVNSSKIDFSQYSDNELRPLANRMENLLKIKGGGSQYDDEGKVENVAVPEGGPTGSVLEVTCTAGFDDSGFPAIFVEWEVYEGPVDDDTDESEITFMEGEGDTPVDESDESEIDIPDQESAEDINEYQVSIWKVVNEPNPGVNHEAPPSTRKFYRTDETSIMISPVEAGKYYHVRVRGINGKGVHSDPVDADHIRSLSEAQETPNPPENVQAVATGPDSIMITWDESDHPLVANGAGTYRVQCDIDDEFTSNGGEPLYARSTGAESTTFTGLSQGVTYYFRVKAKPSTGTAYASDWGPEPTGWITASTGTLGPADISDGNVPASSPTPKITGGPKYLYVKWEPIANNDPVTYEVHLGTSSTFTANSSTKCGEVTGSSFVIRYLPNNSATELSYGTNYYVRVWAKDTDGYATNPAPTGTLTATQCQKIAGGVGGDILADSITANDINSLTITGTKYVQAGGASVTDPYVRMEAASVSETSINTGHLDIYPGKQYAGTENVIAATLEGGSNASTKEVWTYLSSPYFSGNTYAARPVYLKMLTDNDDSTKSEFIVHAQKMWDDARHEGVLYSFSKAINQNTTGLTRLTFSSDHVVGNTDWAMHGTANQILLPRIGQYLVTVQAEFAGGTTDYVEMRDAGARTVVMTKASDTTPSGMGTGYYFYREIITPFPGGNVGTTASTFQEGAMSGAVVVRATSANDPLRFWANNYLIESASPDCTFIIGVYRISA